MRFPHYIALSFGLFIAFIIVLVAKTFQVNNELVTEEYYKQELAYQYKIDRISHVKPAQKPRWNQSENQVVLQFPNKEEVDNLFGQVEFYRPSDASKDFRIPLTLDKDKCQHFPKKLFAKGLYVAKMDWVQNGVACYNEQEIYLP